MCALERHLLYLCELHRLPACFWFQPKMLGLILKALHGPDDLRDSLFQITSTHPIRSGRRGILGVHSVREFHPALSQTLELLFPIVKSTLVTLQKALKYVLPLSQGNTW